MDPAELTVLAGAAADAGAACALAWFGSGRATTRHKSGPRDLVSEADEETERVIRAVLAEHRPGDAVVGEEHGSSEGEGEVTWLVDPIDGTTSFLYGRADWAVSVAAVGPDGRVLAAAVAEPVEGRTTTAALGGGTWLDGRRLRVIDRPLEEALVEVNLGTPAQHARAGLMVDALLPRVRDLRRGGSAAAALTHLAAGRADAAWTPGLQAWDGAAGLLLAQEAGAVVGDLGGECGGRWPASGDVLAAPPRLWEQLRLLIAPAYADRTDLASAEVSG